MPPPSFLTARVLPASTGCSPSSPTPPRLTPFPSSASPIPTSSPSPANRSTNPPASALSTPAPPRRHPRTRPLRCRSSGSRSLPPRHPSARQRASHLCRAPPQLPRSHRLRLSSRGTRHLRTSRSHRHRQRRSLESRPALRPGRPLPFRQPRSRIPRRRPVGDSPACVAHSRRDERLDLLPWRPARIGQCPQLHPAPALYAVSFETLPHRRPSMLLRRGGAAAPSAAVRARSESLFHALGLFSHQPHPLPRGVPRGRLLLARRARDAPDRRVANRPPRLRPHHRWSHLAHCR